MIIGRISQQDAQTAYRGLWMSWLLTTSTVRKDLLEHHMDRLQSAIACGPTTPEWQGFISTLPGFVDYWKKSALPRVARGLR